VHAAALRDELDAAGFTAKDVRAALAARHEVLTDQIDAAAADVRLERVPPALATLVRLLVLGRTMPLDDAEAAVPFLELLAEHGLVDVSGGSVAPLHRLVPHDHLLVASDSISVVSANHVAAVHRPSSTLADLTVRRRVATAVDVGTGNGVQALLCASHVDHVVATDLNERALAFAEFNAAVNRIDNIEFRAGSFFEPVDGERFGLVVCNPPYVISPESEHVYRDSGLPGDAVSAQLVAELPDHLDDGGYGTIMISWVAGEDAAVRPAEWVSGRGCDAWLLHTATEEPLQSALAWNKAAGVEPEALKERIDAWLAYFERLGIERIAYGTMIVRCRSGENWFRSEAMRAKSLRPASGQLERMFGADLDGLLDRPLTLVESAHVDRSVRLVDGAWTFVDATVQLNEGIGFGANLDSVAAALLDFFDGAEPLRDRLPALAEALDVAEDKLEQFAERLARHLVERGIAV